jgi:hypothetical protein
MDMANNVEWLIGAFIVGVFIGALISKNTNGFAVEVTPNNSFRAAIAFNKPALPR